MSVFLHNMITRHRQGMDTHCKSLIAQPRPQSRYEADTNSSAHSAAQPEHTVAPDHAKTDSQPSHSTTDFAVQTHINNIAAHGVVGSEQQRSVNTILDDASSSVKPSPFNGTADEKKTVIQPASQDTSVDYQALVSKIVLSKTQGTAFPHADPLPGRPSIHAPKSISHLSLPQDGRVQQHSKEQSSDIDSVDPFNRRDQSTGSQAPVIANQIDRTAQDSHSLSKSTIPEPFTSEPLLPESTLSESAISTSPTERGNPDEPRYSNSSELFQQVLFQQTLLQQALSQQGMIQEEKSQQGLFSTSDGLLAAQADLKKYTQAFNSQHNAEPVINVSIGRVEVKAIQTATAKPAVSRDKPKGIMSLHDYLKKRNGDKA